MACATALNESAGSSIPAALSGVPATLLRNAPFLQSQSELRFANPRAGDSAHGALRANSHEAVLGGRPSGNRGYDAPPKRVGRFASTWSRLAADFRRAPHSLVGNCDNVGSPSC